MPRTDARNSKTNVGGGGGWDGEGEEEVVYVPPPPISEQKRWRRMDPSIVPSPPCLLLSKFMDYACTSIPVLRNVCPSDGWRSALPPRWVSFPHGGLSHSFDGYYSTEDVVPYITFREFVADRRRIAIGDDARPPTSSTITTHPSATAAISTVVDLYEYAFRTNSTSLSDLTSNESLCALVVLVSLMRRFKGYFLPIFSAFGRRLGRAAHGSRWENDNRERIIKFGEYVHRLLYHSIVSAYGMWYFHDKSWWNTSMGGTKNLWIDHPNQPVCPGMAWYYLVQGAYNVDALISLAELSFKFVWVNPLTYSSALVDERRRKERVYRMMARGNRVGDRDVDGDGGGVDGGVDGGDLTTTALWTPFFRLDWSTTVRGDYREMMSHHVVTNALVFFSSYYRLLRAGSMIFLIHDLSDVPIDMSKLANFVKWKYTTIACFAFMVLMWIITRLAIFPFVICRAIVMDSREYLVTRGTLDPALHDAYYLLFYALLGALVLLHVTWFVILLRIGWTLVTTGERHDYSEHKGGERQKKDN
ncbi:hypothetical protein ACHAXA_008181 [Cyclostephanos tholiformis]|uniref:TLC domain-containing protein n=1 Tax=Cyclostephanos tholiformis TaxID=382380 RepID=A0ABD3SCH1_9STRA